MPDEVLTIAILKLAEKTVHAMTQASDLPAFKIRGQWRVERTKLDRWSGAQRRGENGGRDGGA